MIVATLQFLSPMTGRAFLVLAVALVLGFGIMRLLAGPPAATARRWGLLALRGAALTTLLLILLNPSDVLQFPGPIDRPDVFYLLDASQSMAIGDSETRFDHALRLMRETEQSPQRDSLAPVKLFRFGHRLAAVDSSHIRREGAGSSISDPQQAASDKAGATANSSERRLPLAPTDSDTQLTTALRQVSSRFGRRPPAGIVLFSDGRVRDEVGAKALANQFSQIKVPIHVVPVGDTARGGDVAIVACVAPPRARRFAEVEVQVFLRSYGYDGRRCEVRLAAPGAAVGDPPRLLAPAMPITLHDGFQSVSMNFRTDSKTSKLLLSVSSLPDEISTANNHLQAEVQIDRTKIRVLYLEGSSQPLQPVQTENSREMRGPYSDLQQALTDDEDIECVVLHAPSGRGRLIRVADSNRTTASRGFPETVAELSAFDAIILSDISAEAFTDQQLQWIEKWIGQRGGGLLMVGGRNSFAAGNWEETPLAAMLPVTLREENDWLPGTQVAVRAEPKATMHPLWSIVSDSVQNKEIVGKFPTFFGANRWGGLKPNLTRVLGVSSVATAPPGGADAGPTESTTKEESSTGTGEPAIVIGQYGRGRTMAMSFPITSPWANEFLFKWGAGDTRHYGKFWRNATYWLTENSSIGRRRLVVSADKKFYRPGETITLTAAAFDEGTNQTGAYKITTMIEPRTSLNDLESNYSCIRWPDGKPRDSGESGPYIAWGEEFDLPRVDSSAGKPAFTLELPIADAATIGSSSQSLRIELTAMEEFTQVDSTSVDIQILHDPFEQQNPFPNHEFLASIARNSGGRVIGTSAELTEILRNVPIKVGAPVITRAPLWSSWWLWTWLLGLMSMEWIWRRFVGLA